MGKSVRLGNVVNLHARFVKLYLRSRRGGYAVASLSVTAFLGWVGSRFLLRPAYAIPETVIEEILLTASLLVPLVAACAIGFSARSPFGEEEQTASRSLPNIRFCHIVGLFVYGVLVLSVATLAWELEYAGWTLTRNFAGLVGLALLSARVVGSGLSWVVPLAYGVLAVTVNILSDNPPKGMWTSWVWWPLQSATNFPSIAVALALLVLGLWNICLHGARV